jgi:hypothetical protein
VRALGKEVRIWRDDTTVLLNEQLEKIYSPINTTCEIVVPVMTTVSYSVSASTVTNSTATNSQEEFEAWYNANVPDNQDLRGDPWTLAINGFRYKAALWRAWAASRGIEITK